MSWKKTEHFKETEFGPMKTGETVEYSPDDQAQKPSITCEPGQHGLSDVVRLEKKPDAPARECPHPHNPNVHGGGSPLKPIGEFHMELTNRICELEIERDALAKIVEEKSKAIAHYKKTIDSAGVDYDALSARVAELEATHFTCPECSEVVMSRTSAKIIDALRRSEG